MDWRHLLEIVSAIRALGRELLSLSVWVKTNGGMGSLYRSRHELVFVFAKRDAARVNNGPLGKSRRLEARGLDLEIDRDVRKLFQNNRDFPIVPGRSVCQLVIGEHVGFGLLLAQMLEADHWRFRESKQLGRIIPMTSRWV